MRKHIVKVSHLACIGWFLDAAQRNYLQLIDPLRNIRRTVRIRLPVNARRTCSYWWLLGRGDACGRFSYGVLKTLADTKGQPATRST